MAKRLPDETQLLVDNRKLDRDRDRYREPRMHRRPTEPNYSRRNAIACRFHEVLAARTPEELDEILEAREAEDRRLDAELTEEQRLGLAPVGGAR